MITHGGTVTIIGGGLIGLASAWRLAQRGLRVTVVDPDPAAAASRAAAGMLAPVSEVTYGERALLDFALESLRRYPDFVTELEAATGEQVGLRRDGTLVVATDAGDREVLRELHEFHRSLGLESTLLGSRETRRLEPTLSPGLCAGLHVSTDLSVDNRRLASAVLSAVVACGVTLERRAADALVVEADAAVGVRLSDGSERRSEVTVLAAGPWCSRLPGLPPRVVPPVRPVKGQILRLQGPTELLPTRSLRGFVGGREIYLVPRVDGELVVGASVEDRGFDTTVTAGVVHDLLHDARLVLPAVDEFALHESMAALRPGSPDNVPIVGPTSLGGLVVATGHFRNGVLLAPLTADLVTAVVTGDDAEAHWATLVDPGRFAESLVTT